MKQGIATGWGAVKEQGDISATLQEVVVPILSNNECRKTGYGASRITDNMICAGFKDGDKDSCQVIIMKKKSKKNGSFSIFVVPNFLGGFRWSIARGERDTLSSCWSC